MLTSDINQLWAWRRSGDIDRANETFLRFNRTLAMRSTRERLAALEAKGTDVCDALNFLTYDAATQTRQGEIEKSKELLQELISICRERSIGLPYQVQMQIGLNGLCEAEYLVALNSFRRAAQLAKTPFESLSAKDNQLIAMENLGYSLEPMQSAIRAELPSHKHEPWYESFLDQWNAKDFRCQWRIGDLTYLTRRLSEQTFGAQSNFQNAWLAQLPYMDIPLETAEKHSAGLSAAIDGYMAPYMLNTLLQNLLPDDLQLLHRWPYQIERLYLWTWRWLESADSALLQKLLTLKAHILANLSGALTPEDAAMLQNSLQWLNFFSGNSGQPLTASLPSFAFGSAPKTAVLNYESLLLNWLYACRDGRENNEWQELVSHPLHRNQDWLMPALAKSVLSASAFRECRLFGLQKNILAVLQTAPETDQGIYVRPTHLAVANVNHQGKKQVTISHTLCQLLALFRYSPSTDALTLAQTCFGVERLTELTQQRITRLLAKANQVTKPYLTFQRRGNRIYTSTKAKGVTWIGSNLHTEQLLQHTTVAVIDDTQPPVRTKISVAQCNSLSHGWLSRSELETILGSSRSTTVRKIAVWLKQRSLEKEGIGKATRYRLTAQLLKELTNA